MGDFTRGDIGPWIISAAGIGGAPVRGRLGGGAGGEPPGVASVAARGCQTPSSP